MNLPSGTTACPIWGTPSYQLDGYSARDGTAVRSPRAGGDYFISRHAELILSRYDDKMKIKLTHEIVDHNALGSVPEILTTTIEGLVAVKGSHPTERANRLLRYLVGHSRYLGQELNDHRMLSVWDENDGVFGFTYDINAQAYPMFAWSDSVQTEEVVFLLKMLAAEHLISIDDQIGIPNIIVQPAGYERLSAAESKGRSDQAFIAMWFDNSMTAAYTLGIEAAVRESGFTPLRIDQKEHINKIDDEIVSEIKRSRFLIADFTCEKGCPRGGVYFEAGYALALGKPVIWCCRADMIEDVHFDTRQFNHIVWQDPSDLRSKLKNRIGAVLGDGPFRQ